LGFSPITSINCNSKGQKTMKLLLGLILPPVGIFMTYGVGPTLFINIGLTLLGWLPGSIHAVWAISKHNEMERTI
jgi:uncharacterized membrane protein YqaE (UPF0057 family)